MKKWGVTFVLCAGIFCSLSGYALSFRGVLGMNAEFGGDRLLRVSYSDGSTSDLLAGQGFSLYGGVALQDLLDLGPVGIDLEATVGAKYSSVPEASNATADYFRVPLEFLVFARWNALRLGAGPVYHVANSLTGSGVVSSVNFDNAFGLTAEIDYLFLQHWALGARYTSISYQRQVSGASALDTSNFGVALSYFF